MQILLFVFSAVVLFVTTGILGNLMYQHKDTLFNYSTFHSYSTDKSSLSGNFILKTFFPSVFIVALSWFLQIFHLDNFTRNIWLIVLYYWIIRMVWLLVIFNRASLTNFAYEATSLVLSVSSAFFVYNIFIEYCISNGISVFLSRDELRSGVAFALLLYAINIVWKILNANGLLTRSNIYNDRIILGDLERRTKRLVRKYGSFVRNSLVEQLDEDRLFEKEYFITNLLFSIMIVEDRNRPFLIRKIENIIHNTVRKNKTMTVGIMQVTSSVHLSDKQSILEAIKIILKVMDEYESDPNNRSFEDYSVAEMVCDAYNQSYEYFSEVEFITQTIGEWLDITYG